MKHYFSFVLFFAFLFFQAQETDKTIKKIDNYIKKNNIIPKISNKKIGWNGGYEKLVVYLKDKKPILVEKIENRVMHLYIKDPKEKEVERDESTIISAKFYIINWEKDEYVRIGNINYVGNPYKPTPKITEMKEDYKFEYDKNEVENLIKSEN